MPGSGEGRSAGDGAAAGAGIGAAVGRYRWVICALLFGATTINYVDRQVIGILKNELQHTIGWNDAQYGYIVSAFQAAYAIGLVLAGSLMDRIGTRRGFAGAVTVWSLAGLGHALARTPLGFGIARFALGLGEAGNFPAAIKTVAEWFPRKERALATGIFNAGSNVGAVVAPLVVPWITLHYGWRWAFIVTGASGFLWLLFWLALYRPPEEHPALSKAELAFIRSDPPEAATRIPWLRLLPHRQTWAFALGKFLTDPIWWFYLYWVPDFLQKNYGLDLKNIGPPLVVIYLAADLGSIGGGWLSSALIHRGWSVNAARKEALLVCALGVVPIVFASHAAHLWLAVALLSLATAAHQGWSANLFTLVSDLFPRRAVGSIVGLGGMTGAIGGMFIATAAGLILQRAHTYVPLFLIAGSAYLLALLLIQALVPHLEPAMLGPW